MKWDERINFLFQAFDYYVRAGIAPQKALDGAAVDYANVYRPNRPDPSPVTCQGESQKGEPTYMLHLDTKVWFKVVVDGWFKIVVDERGIVISDRDDSSETVIPDVEQLIAVLRMARVARDARVSSDSSDLL